MRKKFIAGNWKMYTSLNGARELASSVAKGVPNPDVTVAVFPPYPWLIAVAEVLKGTDVALGAQNVHYAAEGAFTGEVAPIMLKEAGCRYTLVGHSERRHGLGETDDFLNRKAKAALEAGLSVIFCIGETLAERKAHQTEVVLESQLVAGLAGLSGEKLPQLVIAYEPVWAIGTGKTRHRNKLSRRMPSFDDNSPNNLARKAKALPIQYGGSVKPENAAVILKQPDVDGALWVERV